MNLNTRINPRWIVGVIAVAVLGVGGRFVIGHFQADSRASEEAKLEEPEIAECKQRLAMFYDAWHRYRVDHNNTDPQSLDVMIPKYIKSADLLICPTAARMAKKGIHVEQGTLVLNGKRYPDTYGFKWLSAGFPLFLKRTGDGIPLIICSSHREATYISAYKKLPQDLDFSAARRDSLIPEVRNAPYLAVRRNGKVEAIDTTKNW